MNTESTIETIGVVTPNFAMLSRSQITSYTRPQNPETKKNAKKYRGSFISGTRRGKPLTFYSRVVAPSNSTSPFRGPLEAALRHALSHLESLDSSPVAPLAPAETLRARMSRPLSDCGVPPEQVLADL